ncbi:MAG: cell division protein FtsI (penicillin-binding protein 3) [Psychromonas sp.]|jgi:cell division protein FtsI (penicillin-binding protein 3)
MAIVFFYTVKLQLNETSTVFSTNSSETQEKIPSRVVERTPRRGEILDANLTPLVTSVSFYDIHIDPTVVKQEVFDRDVSDLCRELSLLYPSKTAREYENYFRQGRNKGYRYLLVKKRITNEERKHLRTLPILKLGRLKGGLIDTEETILRKRPNGDLLSRTLGYYKQLENKEIRVGIEGAYNDFLSGEQGLEIEQKISTGWKKTGQIVKQAVEGADVVTTIDKEIQEVAHSELYRQLQNQGAKNGSAIVMNVKTGEIKAMVNLTRTQDGNYYEQYNYAIGTKEVPGSTFKLASLMAALEDKKVRITDSVNAYGKYSFYNITLKDSREGGYGRISIQNAFELSSNVFSKIIYEAYRNEPETFINRLRSFGVNEKLGIELLGEPTPTLYSPTSKMWSGISLPWMSIGYEVQQTPLQTLAMYNAVANNGKFIRPQFVKEIIRNGKVIKTYEPIILKEKIASQSTIDDLKKCLEGVILRGTGKDLQSAFFTIAGKTGTARILNSDLRYGKKGEEKYQASFVGYFPAEDPIYSCIVVISAPTKDIYGASVSGTVFSAIANKVYAQTLRYHEAINEKPALRENMPISIDGNKKDIKTVLDALLIPYGRGTQTDWVNTHSLEKMVDFSDRQIIKGLVPNVIGLSARDAVFLVETAGLSALVKGTGTVKHQSRPAGVKAYHGNTIELQLN